MYGITETTVHVTYRRIRQADVEAGAGSLIGVPIPDLRVDVQEFDGLQHPEGTEEQDQRGLQPEDGVLERARQRQATAEATHLQEDRWYLPAERPRSRSTRPSWTG